MMPSNGEQIRSRILDAAAEALVDGGFESDRLISDIARRSGLSRPTVYKYGGTLDTIRTDAIVAELTAFVEVVRPRIEALEWGADFVAEFVAEVVVCARGHRLFAAALKSPEMISRRFFLDASLVVAVVTDLVRPVAEVIIAESPFPAADLDVFCDMLSRLAISLAFSRTSAVDADNPAALRDYLQSMIDLFAALRQ